MAQLDMNKIITSVKSESIWPDNIGLDASNLIPVEIGGIMQSVKPTVSIMDLGKMLLQCAKQGETTKVHDLMCRGAPFTTDWLGTSPLHLAALHNHYETCEVLLRAGICKDACTKVDRTPLHLAVYEGNEQIVELLLANKCEVDARDMLKMTPLHWAVEKRYSKIVSILLRYGADPCATSKFFKTPLSIAIETNQTEVFQELLSWNMRVSETELACDTIQMNDFEDSTAKSSESNSTFSTNSTDYLTPGSTGNLTNSPQHQPQPTKQIHESDPALQLLAINADHGISMLDDTENSLFNSALQNGRKLVLSDAGKLLLNDLKLKKPVMAVNPNERSPGISTDSVKKKSGILMPIKQLSSKSNKVIKILSADEFKQMCGGNIPNSIKKISTNSGLNGNIKYQYVPNMNTISSISKPKRIIINKSIPDNKDFTRQNTNVLSSTIKPIQISKVNQKMTPSNSVQSQSDAKFDIISRISSVSSNTQSKPTIVQNKVNVSGTLPDELLNPIQIMPNTEKSAASQTDLTCKPSSLLEIERQLLDLRKQTEELRKQLELSQKQNDEYKIRLEKLEQEKEIEKEDRAMLRYRNGSM